MHRPPSDEWPADDLRRSIVTLRGTYLDQGMSDRALAAMVRSGELAKPRRGAYVAGSAWAGLDDLGRHSLRARAVLAQARTELVLSHVTGLLEYDCPVWGLPLDDVHTTRLDGRIGRPEAGVRQHRGRVLSGDVTTRNGVRVMTPARLALETTTITDVEHALVVVVDLLHRGLTTTQELADRYASMTSWPHSVATDLVLRLAHPLLESVAETRCWYLFFHHSLPMPVPQFEIRDSSGRLISRVDFAWPELGVYVEFDGKVKYEKLLKPGQSASEVVVAEKEREDRIRRLTGWR